MFRTTETRRHRARILCVSVSLWFLPTLAFAQTPPDFSGFWNNQFGINERSWLDTAGHEQSAQLHLVERLKKVDANHIQEENNKDVEHLQGSKKPQQ